MVDEGAPQAKKNWIQVAAGDGNWDVARHRRPDLGVGPPKVVLNCASTQNIDIYRYRGKKGILMYLHIYARDRDKISV